MSSHDSNPDNNHPPAEEPVTDEREPVADAPAETAGPVSVAPPGAANNTSEPASKDENGGGAGAGGDEADVDRASADRVSADGAALSPQVQFLMPDKIFIDLPDNLNINQANLKLNLASDKHIPLGLSNGDSPIGFKMEETKWQRRIHYLSVFATLFVAVGTFFLVWQQNKIQGNLIKVQEKQTEAQNKEADAALQLSAVQEKQRLDHLNTVREEIFSNIVNNVNNKMDAAVMSLSAHGKDALEVIDRALVFDKGSMHHKAAEVVALLISYDDIKPPEAKLRQTLLSKLRDYLKTDNQYLHLGTLTCLNQLQGQLKAEEKAEIMQVIEREFQSNRCDEKTDKNDEIMSQVAIFVAPQAPHMSRNFLLDIAQEPRCGAARSQAITSFYSAWDQNTPEDARDTYVGRLQALNTAITEELRVSRDEAQQQVLQGLKNDIKLALTVLAGPRRQRM